MKFSLTGFLCAITLICCAAFLWSETTERQRAVDAIRRDGVVVSYVYPFAFPGDWRGTAYRGEPDSILQMDFFSDGPTAVYYTHTTTEICDNHVTRITEFRNLQLLLPINPRCQGNDCSELSEESLVRLGRLHKLRYLDLKGARLTPGVLRSWTELRKMEKLYLGHTNMSDDLLRFLPISPELDLLSLLGTQVTAEGIRELGELPRWTTVYLPKETVSSEDVGSLKLQFPYTDYKAY